MSVRIWGLLLWPMTVVLPLVEAAVTPMLPLVRLCVCMFERERECVCVSEGVCVCVCVCARVSAARGGNRDTTLFCIASVCE